MFLTMDKLWVWEWAKINGRANGFTSVSVVSEVKGLSGPLIWNMVHSVHRANQMQMDTVLAFSLCPIWLLIPCKVKCQCGRLRLGSKN